MKNLSGVGVILFFLALAASARGNPYLAKPGEIPATVRVAACAITGGFIHLYTALDYGLFDKYGMILTASPLLSRVYLTPFW